MSHTRQLSAIMFADIVGYTAMMQHDEALALNALNHFKEDLKINVKNFRGKIIQYYGDGSLITFSNSFDAVNCARALQVAFREVSKIPVRIGIHLGDILLEGGNIFGDSVNIASRIQSMGVAGAVLFSDAIKTQIKNKPDFQFTSLGRIEFKNVDEPMEVFALSNPGFPLPKKSELDGKFNEPNTEKFIKDLPSEKKKHKRKDSIYLTFGVLIILTASYFIFSYFNHPQTISPASTNSEITSKSIAVLPFKSLSDDPDKQYLADGMMDAILLHLSKINDLRVMSRTSVEQYRRTTKTTRDIGHELDVEYLLEGSFQKDGDKVRLIVQLIKADEESHAWANEYDRNWKDIFSLQSEIAKDIAGELKTVLSSEEINQIDNKPTENLEAYNYYLLGNEYYLQNFEKQNFEIAVKMYSKAIELDPDFALANVSLALCYLALHWFHYDYSIDRVTNSKRAIDEAFRIDPGLPQAHIALATYYYWGFLNYSKALQEIEIAERSLKNNSECIYLKASVYRRAGEWSLAKENYLKAFQLDPGSPRIVLDLAITLYLIGEYQVSEKYFNKGISINPTLYQSYWMKSLMYMNWKGTTDQARATIDEAFHYHECISNPILIELNVLLDIYDGNYQKALTYLLSRDIDTIEGQYYISTKSMLYARIYNLLSNPDKAHAYYDSARITLESKILQNPDNSALYGCIGIAYAGLGQKEKAIEAGEKAVELMPIKKEAYRGVYRAGELSKIYVMVGEYEAALKQIKLLLALPGPLSPKLLQLDPDWKPLWNLPEFQQLVKEYSDK